MRIRDWSSDVCASDLNEGSVGPVVSADAQDLVQSSQENGALEKPRRHGGQDGGGPGRQSKPDRGPQRRVPAAGRGSALERVVRVRGGFPVMFCPGLYAALPV